MPHCGKRTVFERKSGGDSGGNGDSARFGKLGKCGDHGFNGSEVNGDREFRGVDS